MVAFRPHGNTDIFKKTQNYNFEQRRKNIESFKFRAVVTGMLLSLIPIFMFVRNAEQNFRNAQVKELASRRRERLDKEHGVDREQWKQTMQEADKMFRVTEKEEIEKFR